jgi:hypothetical protein
MKRTQVPTGTPRPKRRTALALLAALGIIGAVAAGTVAAPTLATTAHAGGPSGGVLGR